MKGFLFGNWLIFIIFIAIKKNKRHDKRSVTDFFENWNRKLKQTNKNVSFEKNKKGLLFKIGNRQSARHYCLYTKDNFLRFEFEIKRNFIKDLHQLLIQKRFEEFEKILSYQFFKQPFELFHYSTQSSLFDWLMNRIRPYQNRNQSGFKYLKFILIISNNFL